MLAAIIDDVDLVVLDFSIESIEVAIGVERDARRNLNTRPAASIKRRMEKPLEEEREREREKQEKSCRQIIIIASVEQQAMRGRQADS